MASIRPDTSREDVLQSLTEQARFFWGNDRTEAIRASLEQTAEQLRDVSRTLPAPEVEPGFYQ